MERSGCGTGSGQIVTDPQTDPGGSETSGTLVFHPHTEEMDAATEEPRPRSA